MVSWFCLFTKIGMHYLYYLRSQRINTVRIKVLFMHLSLRSFSSEQQNLQLGKPNISSLSCSMLRVCPLLVMRGAPFGTPARVQRGAGSRSGPEQSPGFSSLQMQSDPKRGVPLRFSRPAVRSQPGVLALPADSNWRHLPSMFLNTF